MNNTSIRQHLALLFLVSCITFIACFNTDTTSKTEDSSKATNSAPSAQLIVFDRLIGTWKSEDGKSFERWTKKTDSTYQSQAFTTKRSDTIIQEEAIIYQENSRWVFENTVRGQNNGQPIKFTSTQLTDNSVQFSNPAHDFPTDINYTVPDNNTVRAFIIGPGKNGSKDTIQFNYTRLK